METGKKNKTYINRKGNHKSSLIILLIIFSMTITLFPSNRNVSAAGTTSWYAMDSTDLLDEVGNSTYWDIMDYIGPLEQTDQVSIYDFGVGIINDTETFTAGHIYYFFVFLTDDPNVIFRMNDIDVKNNSFYTKTVAGSEFSCYAFHFNSTVSVRYEITTTATSWRALDSVHNLTLTRNMMLGYTPLLEQSDGIDTYLNSWYAEDTNMQRLHNGSIVGSVNSIVVSNYLTVKNVSANTYGYCNLTTNTRAFKGDIYLVIRVQSGNNFPAVTEINTGEVAQTRMELSLSNGDYVVFYRVSGIYTYYKDQAPEDINISINNVGAPVDEVYVVRPYIAAESGVWSLYTWYMGYGFYNAWCTSTFIAEVSLFIHDGINPMSNVFCYVTGVGGAYDYTDEYGYTKYFSLTKNVKYKFTMYDTDGNEFIFWYKPLRAGKIIIPVQFIITPIIDPYISFNFTMIDHFDNTHNRVRYYYFLDQGNNVYQLNISCGETNTSVYGKRLRSNTGYLDYFFTTNGTYFFNISEVSTGDRHNSNIVLINVSEHNYYFHPEYTSFRFNKNQPFYYYSNISSSISPTLQVIIPGEFTDFIVQGESRVSNVTIMDEGVNIAFQNFTGFWQNRKYLTLDVTTTWTRHTLSYVMPRTEAMRFSISFNKKTLTSFLDAVLLLRKQTTLVYGDVGATDSVSYIDGYTSPTFFNQTQNTQNASLTITGQSVSHSGTLTNGTESSATNLTGIFTGTVQVSANISGSGQCILKINGTRIVYEDSVIFMGRFDNVYRGRYYGDFSPTLNTTDFIVVTTLWANVTANNYSSIENRLTLSIRSCAKNQTTSTNIYSGSKELATVFLNGTKTYNWTYNNQTGLSNLNITHTEILVVVELFFTPKPVIIVPVEVFIVIVATGGAGAFVAWYWRRKKKTRTVNVP